MLVTVFSECKAAAWRRTRRVMDAYLERMGERSWTGHLTEEALKTLRAELVSLASKNTSVAAHRVVGTKRFELLWIVGSSRLFGPDGKRATYTGEAYLKYIQPPPAPVLPYSAILQDAVELAGLWHDIGKANAEFQDKLTRNAREADSVRHEILSTLALIDTCRHLLAINGREIGASDVEAAVRAAIAKPRTFLGPHDTGDPAGALAPIDLPQPLRLVSWLIATHHRLPMSQPLPGRRCADENLFTLEQHAHESKFKEGPRTIVLDPRILDPQVWSLTLPLFSRLTGEEACAALADWRVNSVFGRIALVLADHRISSSRFEDGAALNGGVRPPKDGLNANWEHLEAGERVPKQSVIEHVVRVGMEGRVTVSDVLGWPSQARGIECKGLPVALRSATSGRFAWQTEAMEAVRANRREDAGFFGLLMAGTGAGKTRTIPKILSKIGPKLRYTLGLSLRSLTLQAGTSYRNDLGLTNSEVATIIGDAAVTELHERNLSRVDGSENAAAMSLDVLTDADVAVQDLPPDFDEPLAEDDEDSDADADADDGGAWALLDLPPEIKRHVFKERGVQRMLATPIIVSTIDQLMAAADGRRTGYVPAALRLMSSDLVIDEADNFEEMDFVAIGRLVYLAGLFGRAVLLSSAMIPPGQAAGLYSAYRSGFLAHARATGKTPTIDVGLFGDAGQQSLRNVLLPIDDVTTFRERFAVHAKSMIEDVRQRPVYRSAQILPRPLAEGRAAKRDEIYRSMLAALRRVHEERHEVCPRTGRRLTIQLIKVSHVKSAVDVAKWMAGNGGARGLISGFDLRALVYHGGFPLAQRNMIEVLLDELLRDRHEGIFGRKTIKHLLRTAVAPDIMIVVIATGVEEVGRDHDFDGAIIDPSSSRSFIQCSGRVERHRLRPLNGPNIYFLPAPLSFLLKEEWVKDRPSYSRPGVEQAGMEPIGEAFLLSSPWLDDVIDPDAWRAITAKPRLEDDGLEELVGMEHHKTEVYLNGPSYYSLQQFHEGASQAYLAGSHAERMRFRLGSPQLSGWLDLLTGSFMDGAGKAIDQIIVTDAGDGLGDLRLLDLSLEATWQGLAMPSQDRLGDKFARERASRRSEKIMRFSVSTPAEGKSLRYHPDFGVYKEIAK